MRLFVVLVACGAVAAASSAQTQIGFESCVPGPISVGGCFEAWSSAGGTAVILPDQGGALGAPAFGFPTEGIQWGLVSAEGAAGGFAVPPGGPAPFPLPFGSTGNIRLSGLTLPVPPSGETLVIAFAYTYCTSECSNDFTFNDFLTVDLVAPSTSLPIQNLLYLDTFSSGYATPALTPGLTGAITIGPCAGQEKEVSPRGVPKQRVVVLPSSLYGITVDLNFHVGNGGDANISSYAWIDDVRIFTQLPPFSIVLSSPLGSGSFQIENLGLTSGVEVFNVFTVNEPCPGLPGTGPGQFLGLCPGNPQTLVAQVLLPPASPPFRFTPNSPFAQFGPYLNGTIPSGTVIEAVSFELGLTQVAPAVRHVIP